MLWPWLLLHGTMIHHSQAAQPSCPTSSSSTLYLKALLRPTYFSLTAFPFYILRYNFLKYKCLKPWCFSLSALGHHVTPLPMLSPLISTHCLQHGTYAVLGVWFRISWLTWHMITSMTVSSYPLIPNWNKWLDAGPPWPIPWDPTCKNFSQQYSCTLKSCNICVFSKQFSSWHFCIVSNA